MRAKKTTVVSFFVYKTLGIASNKGQFFFRTLVYKTAELELKSTAPSLPINKFKILKYGQSILNKIAGKINKLDLIMHCLKE